MITIKQFVLLIGISIVSQTAVAQCRLTATLSTSGKCSGSIDAGLQKAVAEAMVKHYNGKTLNSQECQQARDYLIGLSGSRGGCTVRINAVCGGCVGAAGATDVLAVGKGTSFYSVNGVNEVNDWNKDHMEQMLALNPKYDSKEPETVYTGDDSFDRIIENMPYSDEAFSGRRPRGSTHIKTDDNITIIGQPEKGNGVLVPDDFTNKKFNGLGVWHSDDLKPLNIDLKPVPNGIKTFDEEGWDLWRDGLKLGKDMGMFVYGLQGAAEMTVAVAGLLADLNINLYTEIYKAYKKSSMGEAYEAADPNNLYTEAAVFWGGKEYAIVGNIFYNTASATLDDFMSFINDEAKNKISEKAINEVRNKALKESVSNSLPDTGKGLELLNIAKNSFDFGGKWVEYHKNRSK